MSAIEIKRGSSLELVCAVQAGGVPVNIAGWAIESVVNLTTGERVHTFSPEVLDAVAGEYRLLASAGQTAGWPVGACCADIKYTAPDGFVYKTQSFMINVVQDETP